MPKPSQILPVPYYVQPSGVTCQSTVLKMMASYLEQQVVLQSTGAADKGISEIWTEINAGSARPIKLKNAHGNMKWWLERHFPLLHFTYMQTKQEDKAIEAVVGAIDSGFPVLVSVSHARVEGHIILVVGYENYSPGLSSPEFELIAHDPYGRFDPSLLSDVFGVRRREGGASLLGGGEMGPGRAVRLSISGVSRQRADDVRRGNYELIFGSW